MKMPVRLVPVAPGASLRWPIAAVVWLIAVLGVAAVNHITARGTTVCTFRNLTGRPCAFCGGTRAALALGQGDWQRALALNPLVVVMLIGIGGWSILRFGLRRRLEWRWQRAGRAITVVVWSLAITALFANWIYLWMVGT